MAQPTAQPLRIALLWHMHQPLYRIDDENLLPWTRLHATKDYFEMLEILGRHPEMRCTINFVPSLLLQIRGYANEGWTDEARDLVALHPSKLTRSQIDRLLYYCRILPRDRMVDPHDRFRSLIDRQEPIRSLGDVRDLQVWYALSWLGEIARERWDLQELIAQGEGFTDADKERVLRVENEILESILPTLRSLEDADSPIELSTTPFYHPILPLLDDLKNGEIADPGCPLPEASTAWTEDVRLQLEGSMRFHQKEIGCRPKGCWPSEGSVSTRTLEAIAEAGFSWSASDESILARTLGDGAPPYAHCFPWRFERDSESLMILFRDHDLSDRIGFLYSKMNPVDAVDDFIEGILSRRSGIIQEYGEDVMTDTVLPVILDGENCWEYYEKNGLPFLEELYSRLSEHRDIEPVSFSDVHESLPAEYSRTLESIHPGSWIGANFRIWVGGPEENRAWELLAQTRNDLMNLRSTLPEVLFFSAYEEFLAAEGSDWFWWFGEENSSENDMDFDLLFRRRLMGVYSRAGISIPEHLNQPIRHPESGQVGKSSIGTMHRATFSGEEE